MKINRFVLIMLLVITSWSSAYALLNPIVTINKTPVMGDGNIAYNTEITFKTTITYPPPTIENEPQATVVSYTWNFGDPWSGSANIVSGTTAINPTMMAKHTFDCGAYRVTLTYVTNYGETLSVFHDLSTQNAPITTVIPTSSNVCVTPETNPSVTVNIHPTGSPLQSAPSYTWEVVDAIGNQQNPDYLVFKNHEGNIINANGIVNANSYANLVYVNFNNYPPSTFPVTITLQCRVSTVPPDGNCKSVATKTIIFKQGIVPPTVCTGCTPNNLGQPPSYDICANISPIQLGSAPVAGVTYTWTSTNPANGSALAHLSATNIANPIFTPHPGTASYTITGSIENGCTNSATVIYRTSTVAVTLPATVSICKSDVITATANGGFWGHSYTYEWTSPNSNTAELSSTTIRNPTFTSIIRGIKNFQVTVTDQLGCSASKTVAVDFKNSNLSSISGLNINWCNDSHVINGAQLFSGGTSPFRFNPSGTPKSTLNELVYTVNTPVSGSLSITDGDGCTATSNYTVTGTPLAINITQYNTVSPYFETTNNANNGYRDYTVCSSGDSASLDINFTISGGCPGYTYRWLAVDRDDNELVISNNPNTGTMIAQNTYNSNLKFRLLTTAPSNIYFLLLVAEDQYGTRTSKTVTRVVVQNDRQPTLTNICNGLNVYTTATIPASLGPITYEWTYPEVAQLVSQNTSYANSLNITLSYTTNKIATVNLKITNSCGVRNTSTVYVAGPQTLLNAGVDKTICTGNSTQLNATNGILYTWSPITGLSNPTIANPVATPSATTTYTVSTTFTGCSNPTTDQVKVYVSETNPSVPASWKRGFLSDFYTPAIDNVISTPGSNQIFYRTADNNIHSMYWNPQAQEWQWSGLVPVNNAAGELTITPNGQLFYRTTSNQLHSLQWTPANGWQHIIPVDWITNVQGPIVATNGQVFYRTTDNKIQSIYLTAPNQWAWSGLNNAETGNASYAMAYNYADGRLYYRTGDKKINCLYWTPSTDWQKSNMNNIAGTNVGNSITIAQHGQIFYKTDDGKIESLYKDGGNWAWSGLNYPTNVAGDLFCDQHTRVFFRTNNNTINYLYWTPANGWQTHTMDFATSHNGSNTNGMAISSSVPYGNITVAGDGNVYYRVQDGRIRTAYYEGPCDFKIANTRDPENPANTVSGVKYAAGYERKLPQGYYFINCSGAGIIDQVKIPTGTLTCSNNNYGPHGSSDNPTHVSVGAAPTRITYEGYINVPVDGTYAFYLNSDDGSRMYIGNKLVVDNDYDGEHAMLERQGFISLKAGKHKFTVDYQNKIGASGLELRYEGPTLYKQLIPSSSYFIVSTGARTGTDANIDLNKERLFVHFYPNPFNKSFTIAINAGENKGAMATVELHTVLGDPVLSTKVELNEEKELTVEGPAGLYVGTVTFEDGSVQKFKVIKE